MQTHGVTSNQDGGASEFSLQGTCATPVNIAAVAAKDHASTFECTLAVDMTNTHKRCAAGRGQDDRHLNACQMNQFLEVGK